MDDVSRIHYGIRKSKCYPLRKRNPYLETYTRNTLDLQSIPVVRKLSHLPVVVDPSHAGGKWWLVDPMAKASIAAGADGLIIEVHNSPETALCDGAQSLKPEKYDTLLKEITGIAKAVGKEM